MKVRELACLAHLILVKLTLFTTNLLSVVMPVSILFCVAFVKQTWLYYTGQSLSVDICLLWLGNTWVFSSEDEDEDMARGSLNSPQLPPSTIPTASVSL